MFILLSIAILFYTTFDLEDLVESDFVYCIVKFILIWLVQSIYIELITSQDNKIRTNVSHYPTLIPEGDL